MPSSKSKDFSDSHKQGLSILALEDGRTYEGIGFGAPGTFVGELVFNTSMCGYQEILTDPSYAGQIITLTYPEAGNYGTNEGDMESRKVYAKGLVVRHLSKHYSSYRAQADLDSFLLKHGVAGIADLDTRSITRHIRDKGAMRCAITTDISEDLEESKARAIEAARLSPMMTGLDLTCEVTCPHKYTVGEGKYKIAVLDYGIKQNILELLAAQGLHLTVYPADTSASEILEAKPDGIFLSNGPGDPAACDPALKELSGLIAAGLPIFGICLGHQLLAISLGAKTFKLKFGHRGGNQPVKNLDTGKVEVTCQNHGFAVEARTAPAQLKITHINLNDNSVEGFKHATLPIFGVQYHPEANPGPHDSNYLFKQFFQLIESQKAARS
ncbi:MAG: glutamine-hydrolyzing carbamoyl-phosphate synthase small subunit [Candidatus Obscuribacterales bacterium]|nr:glutamine-hydrolyzing carbamoyl-phosphate synthase small subunit [Candidatus Obscuribacterales bacterium]